MITLICGIQKQTPTTKQKPNRTKPKQNTRLIDKENRFVVTRGRDGRWENWVKVIKK